MEHRFRMTQDVLEYTYENAKGRMDAHPDIAEEKKNIIKNLPHFNSEKEALETAFKMEAENPYSCQIWAKIEKSNDIYRIVNWWIVTDDVKVKQAADYIGMAQMYDEARLCRIIDNNVKIDDVVAYW